MYVCDNKIRTSKSYLHPVKSNIISFIAYYSSPKSEIIFSLQLGLATVWAQGNYSIKLFRIPGTFRKRAASPIAAVALVKKIIFCPVAAALRKVIRSFAFSHFTIDCL